MKIAIIGLGPTGLYTFSQLVRSTEKLEIVVYDEGEWAGAGTPYSRQGASRLMLANIASIEIPELNGVSYLDWLKSCPARILSDFGIEQDELSERLFTPRLLIGCYFHDQFLALQKLASEQGHEITLNEKTAVLDITDSNGTFCVIREDGRHDDGFDRVVLATGHDFGADQSTPSYYPNPWCGLLSADVPASNIGIMGTSLSAIDACLAVVAQHGEFQPAEGDALTYQSDAADLSITFMSRNGILPEADFYCPIPYTPTQIMNEQSLAKCQSRTDVLDAVFELFAAEITHVDPDYATRIGLSSLTADTYPDVYFAERLEGDPFRWAARNLEEVEHNKAAKRTIHWRYAILRMHEQVEQLVPFFSEEDMKRFERGLKRVFGDNYAAVPSKSIQRLLALRDANKLKIVKLEDDYELVRQDHGTTVQSGTETHSFDVFIDARGQRALGTADLKFPSLRKALLEDGQEVPAVDDGFCLTSPAVLQKRIYLAALPYLLHLRPFVQGIVASAEIGAKVAEDLLANLAFEARSFAPEHGLQENVIAA